MIKSLALVIAAGLLAGCGSTPSAAPAPGKALPAQKKAATKPIGKPRPCR